MFMRCVLCVLVVSCMSSWTLDLYETKGTFYQVGYNVGERFRENIQQYYAEDTTLQTKLLPFVGTPAGKQVYNDYLEVTRKHYPQYLEELHGLADGSHLPFQSVFTNTLFDELTTMLYIRSRERKSCTDAYVNGYDNVGFGPSQLQVGIGHNEDGNPNAKNTSYLLHVIVVDNNTGNVIEDFTSFTYPGSLPGEAYGFNVHGIVLSMNAEYPAAASRTGLPNMIVLRAALGARNRDELEDILKCRGTGIGYGHNLNYGNTQDEVHVLTSYELAPIPGQSSSLYSKYTVGVEKSSTTSDTSTSAHGDKPHLASTNTTGRYFHANIYNHTVVEQLQADTVSSVHRLARIAQLPKVQNLHDIRRILGDTADKLYPIYRTPRPTDDVSTLSTGVYDLVRCLLYIYTDNPASSDPTYTLPLPPGQYCHAD